MQIGEALKKLFTTGVVQRSEMFITSKLWYVFLLIKHRCGYFHFSNMFHIDPVGQGLDTI